MLYFSLSPVKDEKKKGSDKGIFLVNMNEKQEVEEYEPYANRVVEHPTTWVLSNSVLCHKANKNPLLRVLGFCNILFQL